MRRILCVLTLLLPALAMLLVAAAIRAEPSTSYLVEQLRTNEDYRVRTQAALALGASGNDAAIKPLCDALADVNTSVRVASAAALGKLAKALALPCLETAERKEDASAVKLQLQKSIAALRGAGAVAAPPPPGVDTKYYVAIDVTNKTGRPAPEIEPMIRGVVQAKLLARAGYAVAPIGETTIQGAAIVKAKKLKGFYLIATVEPPLYEGGNLTQVVRLSMWTYPGKALQGEFAPKLTQSGTPQGDTESENLLMKMCVEHAIETFQKVVASM